MSYRAVPVLFALTVVAGASACSQTNPSQPSGQSVPTKTEALTASVGAPRPLTPANSALVRNVDQPVTLVVQNGVSTKSGSTYTFEVATDSAFGTKVQSKAGVAEGTNGQTSVKLDTLAAATDYYWHARLISGGTTGVFGATYKFTVGAAVSLSAPVPIAPLTGAQTGSRPTLRVTNTVRQGPAVAVTYRFDVSTAASFNPIVMTATVAEGVGETDFVPTTDMAANTTFFWRATATDTASGVSSSASPTQSFITSLTIDLTKVVYLLGPDLSTWKQTGRIIAVEQDGNAATGGVMCISFTDPGWPDALWIYGGSDPNFAIFGNQWYFANIGGTWYGGPGEWLYRGGGSCKAGQGTNTIGPDSGFGNPFSSWAPKAGELVGFAVSASARALPAMATVQERTDVVLQPWHDSSLAAFTGQPMIQFKRR